MEVKRYKKILFGVLLVGLGLIPISYGAINAPMAAAANTSSSKPVPDNDCLDSSGNTDLNKCTLVSKYINPAIKLLAAVAALAAIVGITVGAIEYSSSGGDPQRVSSGKKKITGALVGFVSFLFLASFIQFLSPGGVQTTPISGSPSAASCGQNFMGLKPWFAYLDDTKFDEDCAVVGFETLPSSGLSDIVPVTLAIVDDMLRIAGLVAVIFIIVAGVKYITSQGEPDATKQAKDAIINAIIGLVIAIIAAGVITFIGRQLTN